MLERTRGTVDMTEGNIFSKFILFMIPVFFGNLVQQVYGLVDSVIVGRSMGSEALAAIGATDSLTYFVIGCVNGVGTGFAICTAQAKGGGDNRMFGRYTICITRLSLIISVGIGAVMFFITPGILHLMNTPKEICELSALYLRILFLGLPGTMCLNTLLAVLRSIGNSHICFFLLILSTGMNIVLDIVMISHLGFGVVGAAVATVISQLTVLIAGIFYTKKTDTQIRFFGETDLGRESGDLMRQGIPVGIQVGITAVATMIIQIALNHCGTECIAAFTIGTKIQNMLTQLFHALGMTVATFVGQNTGKGDFVRVRQGMRAAALMGVLSALFSITILVLFLDVGIDFFGDDVTEKISRDCHYFMNCCMLGYLPLTFLFVLRSALQAMGESKVTLVGGICELIARALVAAFLVRAFGYYGVCFGHTAAWTMALIPLVFIYFRKRKNPNRTWIRREVSG